MKEFEVDFLLNDRGVFRPGTTMVIAEDEEDAKTKVPAEWWIEDVREVNNEH